MTDHNNTPNVSNTSSNVSARRIHPLVAAASVSVILASLVGVAAMTGILPVSHGAPQTDLPVAANASDTSKPTNLAANTPSPTSTAKDQKANIGHDSNTSPVPAPCDNCGVVESVHSYEQKAAKGSGVGAVAGALIGGVLGHEVGGGNGRKLATVAGAVGGGLAGDEIEKRRNAHMVYEVKVRMENGTLRTFKPSSQPNWRNGDHVRIVNGNIIAD